MRIDAYNQITQLYGAGKSTKAQASHRVSGSRDNVTISQAGRDYQIARQAAGEIPDIRENKVAETKSQIDAGTYSVDVGDFASKLLEKYKSMQ